MKKTMTLALIMAVFAMMLNFCYAQTITPSPTKQVEITATTPTGIAPVAGTFVPSEQMAAEYASKEPTVKFYGDFYSKLEKQGSASKDERAIFTLQDGQIIYMMITTKVNQVSTSVVVCDVSKGDQPLDGIYPPMDGFIRNSFNIYARGVDKDDHPTVYGSMYYPTLITGQAIAIELRPEASVRFIDRPADVSKDLALTIRLRPNADGSHVGSGYYDSLNDRFIVWVQPFQAQMPVWEIIDMALDTVLKTGTISFLPGQTGQVSSASSLSLVTASGTREIKFDQWGSAYFDCQKLTGWTNTKEGPAPSLSYFVDLAGKPLYVQTNGGIFNIVVRDAETGDYIDSSVYQNGISTVELIAGFGPVTITVTGQLNVPDVGFVVYATTNPPTTVTSPELEG